MSLINVIYLFNYWKAN